MNLLFLTVMPSPYQRQLFKVLASLPSFDLQVFYFTGGAHDREWDIPKMYSFEKILPGRTLHRLGGSAHWNPGVLGEIDLVKPDLTVISDYSAPTAQWAMRRLALQRRPFIFWGEVPGFSKRGVVGRVVRSCLQAPLRKAEAIAGIGNTATQAYQTLFPGKPVYNIPYFCDLSAYRQAANAAGPGNGTTIDVLFSGQMIHRKGVDLLLDAFARIADKHPRLRLLLLGGGPELGHYKASVPDALRERVIFLGHRAPETLPDVFAKADIFCLPSRHDGWGVVVNEALGAGLPMVVSDAVGAGGDLIEEGENGYVVQAGQVEPLAVALDRLAGDDALRARMAEKARAASLHWDVDRGAARWKAAAEAVLEQASAR